ncbi:23S rRNA pseudouridine(955/2504/2580) synthase RluC [Halioxenophilus aromaticivorans]|uniref:Pseudouridine synthase n=1 Tax=Halioxenophilus aromaticivorans TaxID=1306992 RepID=A0AAV3UA95_9ALTE
MRVNKARVKPEYKLKAGDLVRIPPIRLAEAPNIAAPSQSLWRHLESSILYETDAVMVINKPSGIAVHGGDGVDLGLIEAMRQIRSDCRYLELVHRLDKATSGCVMLAKKRSALKALQQRLRAGRGIQKRYRALVMGAWPERVQLVDQPLKRLELPDGNRIVKVHPEGKLSQTRFQVVERFMVPSVGPLTLVQAEPLTGRTHQIRVHAQFSGHSLVGDPKYGDDQVNREVGRLASLRLCLHACGLSVPPGEDFPGLEVEAPLLTDLVRLLEKLRQGES